MIFAPLYRKNLHTYFVRPLWQSRTEYLHNQLDITASSDRLQRCA
jgi:hypothetical protein